MTTTIAEKMARIGDLKRVIETHEQEVAQLESEVCTELAPFKAGDVIEWGRKRKARGRIVYIIGSHLDDPRFRTFDYRVVLIRKDGTEGKSLRVYQWDRPTKAV